MKPVSPNKMNCKICLMEHDEEIHQATLHVHKWFHQLVVRGFADENDEPVREPRSAESRVA